MMRTTLSVIKADIGSIGGHIKPSHQLLERTREFAVNNGAGLIDDIYVSHTGDDIALLFSHQKGTGNEDVHKLAWDAFSGNIKGMGPAVAEMGIDKRPSEPFLFFAADKTDPGAYNLPLFLAFTDPMFCPGLMLSPKMRKGFTFKIMDVEYTEGDRIIELNAPEDLYDIATLLRDNERFVVENIYSRENGEIAASVSTSRLHNIAGKYTGKDDPVSLVRVQGNFPATGEVLSPYSIGHYVAGFMRGSHIGPLMPVKINSPVSYFDGPPLVACHAFCVHNCKSTEPADVFDHPFWDYVRNKVSRKALELREQGFSGAAMLPYSELEYGGIVERLERLDKLFKVRE
jgi:fructose 1,6-bisphosphate aldolase/phosphatase